MFATFLQETQDAIDHYEHHGDDSIHINFEVKKFCNRYIPKYSTSSYRKARIYRAIISAIALAIFFSCYLGSMWSWTFWKFWVICWILYNGMVALVVHAIVFTPTPEEETEVNDYSPLDYTSIFCERVCGMNENGEPDAQWMLEHYKMKNFHMAILLTWYIHAEEIIRCVDCASVALMVGVFIGRIL